MREDVSQDVNIPDGFLWLLEEAAYNSVKVWGEGKTRTGKLKPCSEEESRTNTTSAQAD